MGLRLGSGSGRNLVSGQKRGIYTAATLSSDRAAPVMILFRTLGLFVITAVAEIIGCYLPYLWLRKSGSPWLLFPAGVSLALFAWLLALHPAASGRVYAAYGGVYVAVALLWLWWVDGVALTRWDVAGVAVVLVGMGIIVWGGWQT